MEFKLNKTIDMIRIIIMKCGFHNSIQSLKLIKLLYICDRCMIKEHGRSISEDEYYSLKRGPILSHAYELIKPPERRKNSPFKEKVTSYLDTWNSMFKNEDNILILTDPKKDFDSLDPEEKDVIEYMLLAYGEYSGEQLVDITHSVFHEWKDPTKEGKNSAELLFDEIKQAIDNEYNYNPHEETDEDMKNLNQFIDELKLH